MSEVKLYRCIGAMEQRSRIGGGKWASTEDLDRVTAERDALQQRLTTADEREDALVTALSKIKLRLDAFVEAERDMPSPSVEVCQSIACAALKSAEGQLNQCDGCQAGIPIVNGPHRMGKPGGYPDMMGCTAKLYRPAEGGDE